MIKKIVIGLVMVFGLFLLTKKKHTSNKKIEREKIEKTIEEVFAIPAQFLEEDKKYINKFKSYTTSGIEKFLEENSELSNAKNIFYPFSGGDILYPLTIFPEADNIFLVSIEPLGSEKINNLVPISNNTKSLVDRSFLVTKNMRESFSDDFGVLNMIAEELTILGVDKFVIKEFNKEKKSFVISFLYNNRERNIFYFKKNINDFYIDEKFLKNIFDFYKIDATIIKAASYLMHDKKLFHKIRNFIISHSKMIVQDDSGIPIRFFKNFDLKFIGTYKGPYGKSFKRFFQKELVGKKSYSQNVIHCYGYGGGKRKPFIILAKRKL